MKLLALIFCGVANIAAVIGLVTAPTSDITFAIQGVALLSIAILIGVTLFERARRASEQDEGDADG